MSDLSNLGLENFDFAGFLQHGFVYQCPCDNQLYIGKLGDEAIVQRNSFFISDFFQNNLSHEHISELICTDINILSLWIDQLFEQKLILQKLSDNDHDYQKDVESCLQWIDSDTQLTKLVSVSYASYETNGIHPLSKIKDLSGKLNGFLYGIWNEDRGVIGVSPEPLFFQKEGRFYTYALAGTIATNKENYRYQLLEDPKERSEHNFVIDDIVHKLKQTATDIQVGQTEVFNFGPIAHLKTPISFIYSGHSDELIALLAPTAALGGYPSQISQKYLRSTRYYQFEKEERLFGGVYGLQRDGQSSALVGIRNLYWNKHTAYIHSGSGIVAESNLEKECMEIRRKRSSIEDIFTHE